jgi:NADH:ubiquinone oxidoreductase subunit H
VPVAGALGAGSALLLDGIHVAVSMTVALLWALVLASLMTPWERKVLGAGQRRSGPSWCGWTGLVQLVADGVKLFVKAIWRWSDGIGLGVAVGVGAAFVAVGVLLSTLCEMEPDGISLSDGSVLD